MNKIKIPKSFRIFGQEFEIIFQSDLVQSTNNRGEAYHGYNKILIQKNCEGVKSTPEQIEQTYLHEVVHTILNQLNEYTLRDNEPFVDRVASALHQVLQTSEY